MSPEVSLKAWITVRVIRSSGSFRQVFRTTRALGVRDRQVANIFPLKQCGYLAFLFFNHQYSSRSDDVNFFGWV